MSRPIFPDDLMPVVEQVRSKVKEADGTVVLEKAVPRWTVMRNLGSIDSAMLPIGHEVIMAYKFAKNPVQFRADARSILNATNRAAEVSIDIQDSDLVVIAFFWIY